MDLNEIISGLSGIVWGPVMVAMLVGTGLYLTIRLKFVQIRHLGHSFRCISGKYDRPEEEGDISHFRALAAALSATIGTGNIAGVATAIAFGGPGAVFWMWMTALVGMATKFTSCSLALHFRDVNPDGSASGGPMYYLEKGFKPTWLVKLAGDKRTRNWAISLAVAFALFAMIASFGIGNMVQANSVVDGLKYVLPESWQKPGFYLHWRISSQLRKNELKDAGSLIIRLREAEDPASLYLVSQLSNETRLLVEAYDDSLKPSKKLKRNLIDDLNSSLTSDNFHDEPGFSDVELTEECVWLLENDRSKRNTVRLNRLILQEVYSSEIAPLWSFRIAWLSLSIGVILAFLVALVILGGIKRIAGVAARLVPTMSVVYVAGALVILTMHYDRILECLVMIVKYAFTPYAIGGGAIGATVALAIRFGVARGVFSNESGLGSAPIAHAAAKTREMAREGFVAMLGPFIDTIIICSMTALVILITGAHETGKTSSSLTAHAFSVGLFGYGHYIVGFGLILFAYSTMISWSYYGDRCAEYLFGPRMVIWYRSLFVVLVVVGAVGGLRFIWNLADVLNALMAVPNLIGLLALGGLVAVKTKDYVHRLKRGEFD